MKGRRVDPLILPNGHQLTFAAGKDRFERDVPVEAAPAAGVDVASGGADLRVGISSDILEHEIDESSLALQEREDLDGTIRRVDDDWRQRRLDWAGGLKLGGQTPREEDREERHEGQPDPSPHSSHRTLRCLIVTR
jgi:hypothetical protein